MQKNAMFWASSTTSASAWGIYEWRGADLQKPKGWTLMVGTWISCWARPSFQGLLMMPYMFFFREAFKESSPQKLSKVEFTFFRPVDQRPTDNFSQFLNFFDLTKHARERSKVPKNVRVLSQTFFYKCHGMYKNPFVLQPGRLTWNLQVTHSGRKMIFQTFTIMFHVNLQGCNVMVCTRSTRVKPHAFLLAMFFYSETSDLNLLGNYWYIGIETFPDHESWCSMKVGTW